MEYSHGFRVFPAASSPKQPKASESQSGDRREHQQDAYQDEGIDDKIADVIPPGWHVLAPRDSRLVMNLRKESFGGVGVGWRQNYRHQWSAPLGHGSGGLLELRQPLPGDAWRGVREDGHLRGPKARNCGLRSIVKSRQTGLNSGAKGLQTDRSDHVPLRIGSQAVRGHIPDERGQWGLVQVGQL